MPADEVDPACPTAAAGSRGPCPRSARSARRGSARPCAGRRSGRSACRPTPCITSVGVVHVAQRRRRGEPDAPIGEELAAARRRGRSSGRRPRPASAAQRVLVGVRRAAPHVQPGDVPGDRRLAVGRPAARSARRSASGDDCPYSGSPVFDITDVIDSSRSGWSMASVLDDHPAHRQAHHVGRARRRRRRARRSRRRPCRRAGSRAAARRPERR